MSGESIIGVIISVLCSWGCASLFFTIGLFAEKSQKPAHFWAGSTIDPKRVSDIPAYNHENAAMWKWYSVPYWISGVLFLLGICGSAFTLAGAVVLFIACIPCLPLLIFHYRKIEKKYIR